MQKPEIETVGTTVVYKNRWMTLREDAIIRSDGSTGRYSVVEKPDFADYIARLSQSAGTEIRDMATLLAALDRRMDYFAAHGCAVADHGLDNIVFRTADTAALDAILQKRLTGLSITEEELWQYKTALLLHFGRGYARRGWVMQLHFAAQRNNNTRMFRQLGPDTGYDSIGPAVLV